jgi:hypothetical protein
VLRAYVGTFLSLAAFCCALTWLYLGMRSVMEIGGSCASGGPYEIAQPCPEGVPLLMLGGIFGGLITLALFVMFSSRLGGDYAGLGAYAWPALFLSLGWNFFEFGFDPPGQEGVVWGWLFCGVLFFLMGGLPLLAIAKPSSLRKTFWPADAPRDAFGKTAAPAASLATAVAAPLGASLKLRRRDGAVGRPGAPGYEGGARVVPASASVAAPPDGDGVVDQLERLAALRDRGAIDDEEFERAKRAVLGG